MNAGDLISLITPEQDQSIINELKNYLELFGGADSDICEERLAENLFFSINEKDATITKVIIAREVIEFNFSKMMM